MAKFFIANGLYGEVGPQFGFNIQADSDEIDRGRLENLDIDDVQTFAFALPVGVGYQLDSGIGLDVRYNIGLTDIFSSSTNAINNVFQVSAFWIF